MVFKGTVRNGRIVVDGDVSLPDGTRVDIKPVVPVRRRARRPAGVGGLERLARFAAPSGIRDLAEQHDHYAYGTPKRRRRRASREPQ